MALIDLVKLNAELDEMIARQDAEAKALNDAVTEERSERYAQMVADISEMYEVMRELKGEVLVGTEIDSPYGHSTRDKYYIRINGTYGKEYGVYSGTACWIGPVLFSDSYSVLKRNEERDSWKACLKFRIDDLADQWDGQRDIFRQRFEEECVKLIKAKAVKANERYEAARRKYEEVVH